MATVHGSGRWSARGRNGSAPDTGAVSADPVVHNVGEIVKLEQRDRLSMNASDHIANLITAFSGSMLYVYLHVIWFTLWIVLNLGWLGITPFDPFPFGLLTMIVSLEAIFLSTFVLISQNRQALQSDRRQKLNMQVDVIAEQEITKLMQMLLEIQRHLGIHPTDDPQIHAMRRPTHIAELAQKIDQAEKHIDPEGAKGPDSAADTEA